jgi:hypothetical protein
MLQIKVNSPQNHAYLNQPFNLEITITNGGDSAILINKRMVFGYEKSISRELFADMVDVNDPKRKTYSPAKINRDDPVAEDYGYLQSGESITRKFDFFQYYHPKNQGTYKITIYYQADESLLNCPQNILKGIVASEPITIEILPGKIPAKN